MPTPDSTSLVRTAGFNGSSFRLCFDEKLRVARQRVGLFRAHTSARTADELTMKRRRSENSSLPGRPSPAATLKLKVSAELQDFLRELPGEPEFERFVLSSPSLRNFLLRVAPSMGPDPQNDVLNYPRLEAEGFRYCRLEIDCRRQSPHPLVPRYTRGSSRR